MKILVTGLLGLFQTLIYAQYDFNITGKIEMISNAKRILINSTGGQFFSDINADGSFIIKGSVPKPGTALIFTDSSGADAIWLEKGIYQISCKEIKLEGRNGIYFRIPELTGPRNAEIYNQWNEPRYYFKGEKDEVIKKYKDHSVQYLDSLFNYFPDCMVIPEILRLSRASIGDEAAQYYISMLNQDHLKDINYRSLDNYFKRKEKIEKEIYFTNFKMKDQYGNPFDLFSLNKKLILLDFWSSDCGPCRRKHSRLVKLYEKYAAKGLEIISISLDDNNEDWLKAIEKDKMTWINVSELNGWNNSLAKSYFVQSIPFSLWLDKDKKIISITDLTEDDIVKYLE